LFLVIDHRPAGPEPPGDLDVVEPFGREQHELYFAGRG
jgi:hypothetical protein